MSVCIAVMAERKGAIVCVADEKADFGEFAADNIGEKEDMLSFDCLAMYAGNDPEYAPIILESTKAKLAGKLWTPQVAAECLRLSYHECLQEEVKNKVLSKYNLNTDAFLRNGRAMFTPELFTTICSRIENVKISLRFLVCGFERHPKDEAKCKAHIYEVSDSDAVKCRDSTGMWSIGAGNYLALSSLAFAAHKRGLTKNSSLSEAIYCAMEAKFMEESNGLVGEATNVGVITPDSIGIMPNHRIDRIRREWNKSGAPRIPKGLLETIPGSVNTMRWKKTSTRATRAKLFEDMGWSESETVGNRAAKLSEQGEPKPKPSTSGKLEPKP